MKMLLILGMGIAGFLSPAFAVNHNQQEKISNKKPAWPGSNYFSLLLNGKLDGISSRIQKHFRKNYSNASNVTWVNYDEGVAGVFSENGIVTRVYYRKNGNWNYSILAYGEKNLPAEVRALVKSEYYDYHITVVNQINTPEKTVYLINMEDDKSILTIRVSDGEKQLFSKLIKTE